LQGVSFVFIQSDDPAAHKAAVAGNGENSICEGDARRNKTVLFIEKDCFCLSCTQKEYCAKRKNNFSDHFMSPLLNII